VLYLTRSSIFAIGLHPVGARWIQEHYLTSGTKGQETFSYYGPLNLMAFNVGYHNEHHDLMMVPWSRLPRVRHIAPEFYEGLHSYSSCTSLLLQFVRDRNISLNSCPTGRRPARPRGQACRRTLHRADHHPRGGGRPRRVDRPLMGGEMTRTGSPVKRV
jgi:fatty acid desaturase